MHKFKFNSRGFTLIEMMIALLMTIFLLICLDMAFFTAEKNHRLQKDFINRQLHASTALQFLSLNLHQAGNVGCGYLKHDFPLQAYEDYDLNPGNKLVSNANSLTIRGGGHDIAILLDKMKNDSEMKVSNEMNFHSGDIAMISDCMSAEIFRVKEANKIMDRQNIITQQPLHRLYRNNAQIRLFEVNTFFIKKTQRVDELGKPIFALYLKNIHNHTAELVEGIHEMHFEFDVIQNNKMKTLSAEQITDWGNVVGVKIVLLLNSDFASPLTKSIHYYVALR